MSAEGIRVVTSLGLISTSRSEQLGGLLIIKSQGIESETLIPVTRCYTRACEFLLTKVSLSP